MKKMLRGTVNTTIYNIVLYKTTFKILTY